MNQFPTTQTIAAVFTEFVQTQFGQVTENISDGGRLFLRSLLPFVEDVRPKDRMQGGLALRANESEIYLHPYLFREVCTNGAIMSQAVESLQLEVSEYADEDDVIFALREALAACCQREVFSQQVSRVRSIAETQVDMALNMAPLVSHFRGAMREAELVEMLTRFTADRDHSQFGLMNAVTSVARDARSPERRWRLEELGGGIAAGILPNQPVDSEAAEGHYLPSIT